MGWLSKLGRAIEKQSREARKEAKKEERRDEKKFIKTRGLPKPEIGEIRYGYEIPRKHKDNHNKYIYKHVSQSSRYEWVKMKEGA